MKSINFIPSYRIAARQRRNRVRWWITAIAISLVLELGGIVCGYGIWCGGRMVLAGELTKTTTTIGSADRAIRMLQSELAAQEATLKASQDVQSQPDWSVLLALLARSLGDGAVLRRCELKPVQPAAVTSQVSAVSPAPAVPLGDATAFALKISGCGRTVADVLKFAEGLERAGLFDQIRLVKTDTQPLLAGTAVGFEMECSLTGKRENSK
ncbi:MAG: hypothetical protein NTX87_03925 [Planctomycetota bacterium]|nr:hypothetical protein [Planctomycetota bacterium]